MTSISAAHPTLPLPSYVRVTNLANHRSIVVRVNDRGPYARDRLIDVSVKTAELLGFYGHGIARVKVDYVGRAPLTGSDHRKLTATLREGGPAQLPVQVASGKPFAPTYFDNRPLRATARIPSPPDRPGLGVLAELRRDSDHRTRRAACAAREPGGRRITGFSLRPRPYDKPSGYERAGL
jgi:rare lipoprotein A